MLGWLSADAAFASRRKRLNACGSRATSSGRNLSATNRSPGVLGFVNHAHPPAAELFKDAVMQDGGTGELRGRSHWPRMVCGTRNGVNENGTLTPVASVLCAAAVKRLCSRAQTEGLDGLSLLGNYRRSSAEAHHRTGAWPWKSPVRRARAR